MSVYVPVDLEMVSSGWLVGPDNRVRHVPGLDRIAADLVAEGVRMLWGEPEGGRAAVTYPWRRVSVVSPRVFDWEPCRIRDLFAHELGHCVVGCSCERARAWQEATYGELVG